MLHFVARRLLYAIPVLLGILIVTFALARLIPGDPCRSILGEKATVESCERFAENKGLNEPIPVQLGIYISDIVQGDFGDSIRFSRPVTQILIERLPMTIELSTTALFLALVV
ncbi:MAG: ABC transporter permease, partial [Actinomycetota bacterium]|nr:ABC transporter permease [Actinomycetota bacterium]